MSSFLRASFSVHLATYSEAVLFTFKNDVKYCLIQCMFNVKQGKIIYSSCNVIYVCWYRRFGLATHEMNTGVYQKQQTTSLRCSIWTWKQARQKTYLGTTSHTYSCCSVWTWPLVGYPKLQTGSLWHTFPLLSCCSNGLLHFHVGFIAVVFENNFHSCVDIRKHWP